MIEAGLLEHRADEIGSLEMGPGEIGSFEHGTIHLDPPQIEP
jgi:hypothetical protein